MSAPASSAPAIIVPVANPGAGYLALKPEIDTAVARALASGWYILGAEGKAFEAEFAAWLGNSLPRGAAATRAVGCANGTDALALALRALDIGPGSAVVTVSHTAVATVAAIEMVGATPLLVDIDPDHYTLDPAELSEVLTHPPAGLPPIRAVIAVHLYGQAADLDALLAICARHNVALIEDCAQGARRHLARQETRHVRRHRHVQPLPHQKSRRPRRWRHHRHQRSRPRRPSDGAAPIWLAPALYF